MHNGNQCETRGEQKGGGVRFPRHPPEPLDESTWPSSLTARTWRAGPCPSFLSPKLQICIRPNLLTSSAFPQDNLSARVLKPHPHPVQQAGENEPASIQPRWFYSRNQTSCLRASLLGCRSRFLVMTGTLTGGKTEGRTGCLEPPFPLWYKQWRQEMLFDWFPHAGQLSKHPPGRNWDHPLRGWMLLFSVLCSRCMLMRSDFAARQ